MQRYIFDQETAFANTPQIVPFGVTMVGPVIIEFGTSIQKEKFLPRILNSEHFDPIVFTSLPISWHTKFSFFPIGLF